MRHKIYHSKRHKIYHSKRHIVKHNKRYKVKNKTKKKKHVSTYYCFTVADQPVEGGVSWEDIEEEVSAATGVCACIYPCVCVCVYMFILCVAGTKVEVT